MGITFHEKNYANLRINFPQKPINTGIQIYGIGSRQSKKKLMRIFALFFLKKQSMGEKEQDLYVLSGSADQAV